MYRNALSRRVAVSQLALSSTTAAFALAAAACPVQAWAQDSSPPHDQAASGIDQITQIEDIVVTARRREEKPAGMVSAYTLADSRLEITQPDGPWSVALFGKNLTNRRYMEFFLDALLVQGVSGASMNRGRQAGLQVSEIF